jgi:hypothetical protein
LATHSSQGQLDVDVDATSQLRQQALVCSIPGFIVCGKLEIRFDKSVALLKRDFTRFPIRIAGNLVTDFDRLTFVRGEDYAV